MKKYEIRINEASGRLYQLAEDRIEFHGETYGEYETLEEAKAAFEKCDAEQGFYCFNNIGKKLYEAKYFELIETEYDDDGEYVDEKYIDCNIDSLDLEWNGYEE